MHVPLVPQSILTMGANRGVQMILDLGSSDVERGSLTGGLPAAGSQFGP